MGNKLNLSGIMREKRGENSTKSGYDLTVVISKTETSIIKDELQTATVTSLNDTFEEVRFRRISIWIIFTVILLLLIVSIYYLLSGFIF